MQKKSQKGFSLIELIIVVAIILIIAIIAVPNIMNARNFGKSFGVETNGLNDEKRQIIQPLVTKRLQELRDNLQTAQKEKADLLTLLETTIPEEATQRKNKLNEIEAKITSASNALAKAENLAKYFGFKT